MGYLLAIGGEPNTGKSYSRSYLNGEETFVVAASKKSMYLTKKDGMPIDEIQIKAKDDATMEDTLKKWNLTSSVALAQALVQSVLSGKKAPEIQVKGNYVVIDHLSHAIVWIRFVDLFYPKIKQVIFPDFTHFITDMLTDHGFRERGKTKEAFERYVDLAADSLNTFFKSAKQTRKDLIQVIEFHTEYDEVAKTYKIFTPGGKMLKEKFKPESYFDVFLYTYFIDEAEDDRLDYADRFKFVTRKWGIYDARSRGLFDPETEKLIPNNLQVVIEKIRDTEKI